MIAADDDKYYICYNSFRDGYFNGEKGRCNQFFLPSPASTNVAVMSVRKSGDGESLFLISLTLYNKYKLNQYKLLFVNYPKYVNVKAYICVNPVEKVIDIYIKNAKLKLRFYHTNKTAQFFINRLHFVAYSVNMRFLLLIASDIEANPGPASDSESDTDFDDLDTCPCKEEIVVSGKSIALFITCSKCSQKWHIKCVGLEGLTDVPLKKLKQWCCPPCYVYPEKAKGGAKKEEATFKAILEKMEKMQQHIDRIETKVDQKNNSTSNPENKLNYNAALKLGKVEKNIQQLVKQQSTSLKEVPKVKDPAKYEKTIIVKSYSDKNIKNSVDIRKAVGPVYKDAAIIEARTTVKGHILLEFADKQTAEKVIETWKPDLFGGNKGVVKLKRPKAAGLIKYVCQNDASEEEILEAAITSYPNTDIELFKNKEGRFTGTIKVTFNSEDDLNAAMNNPVYINNHRYRMEKYENRPQIIKCHNCQSFGHVARLCFSKNTICGKCTSKEHPTKDCTTLPTDYKCFHCEGNHQTGYKNCEAVKLKIEELSYP